MPSPPITGGYGPPIGYGVFGVAPVMAKDSRGGSKGFLVTLLVIACLLLGGVLAWGFKERGERARLSVRNRRVEDAYTFVLAKRNDLANFLTDPRTRMIRLEGRGTARGLSVTVAWQEENRNGVLIGDSIPLPPDGSGYMVWLVPEGAGGPVRCDARLAGSALFRPEAGVTSFEFRTLSFGGKVDGFYVTQEERKDAAAPGGRVIYESVAEKRV
jgi:hypothetical protein